MDKVICGECHHSYDANLLACPNCGCPNERVDPAIYQSLLRQQSEELQDLAVEKNRLQTISKNRSDVGDAFQTTSPSANITSSSPRVIPAEKDPSRSIIQTLRRILVGCTNFHGRARRSEFWLFVVINVILGYLIYTLLFASIARDYIMVSNAPTLGRYLSGLISCCLGRHTVVSLVALGYIALMALPALSVTVRRLHDTNRSAWWILLAVLPWFLGEILGFSPWIGVFLLALMLLLDSVPDNKWGKRYGYDNI